MTRFLLLGEDNLREIHFEAHIRIYNEYTNIFFLNALKLKVYNALSELRNPEAFKLFEETYDQIYTRHNFLLNDFAKIRLLETLFPLHAFVNPDLGHASSPPPSEEIIVEH